MSEQQQADNVRKAIAVMTAWSESNDFQVETISGIAQDEGVEGLVHTTYGLANLCGILLTQRERETSKSADVQLQRIAAELPQWLG